MNKSELLATVSSVVSASAANLASKVPMGRMQEHLRNFWYEEGSMPDKLAARVVDATQRPGRWYRQRQADRLGRATAKLYSNASKYLQATEAADGQHIDSQRQRRVSAQLGAISFIYQQGDVESVGQPDEHKEVPMIDVQLERRKWFRRRKASDVVIEVALHDVEVTLVDADKREVSSNLSPRRVARFCNFASRLLASATAEYLPVSAEQTVSEAEVVMDLRSAPVMTPEEPTPRINY